MPVIKAFFAIGDERKVKNSGPHDKQLMNGMLKALITPKFAKYDRPGADGVEVKQVPTGSERDDVPI
jgi:hypothetical protein